MNVIQLLLTDMYYVCQVLVQLFFCTAETPMWKVSHQGKETWNLSHQGKQTWKGSHRGEPVLKVGHRGEPILKVGHHGKPTSNVSHFQTDTVTNMSKNWSTI